MERLLETNETRWLNTDEEAWCYQRLTSSDNRGLASLEIVEDCKVGGSSLLCLRRVKTRLSQDEASPRWPDACCWRAWRAWTWRRAEAGDGWDLQCVSEAI
jgi:hypothetical protein